MEKKNEMVIEKKKGTSKLPPAKRKARRNRYFFMFCFLAFPIVNFLIFYVYTNFNSILMAFQKPAYGGTGEYTWSLYNFKRIIELFGSGILKEAFINTFLFWAVGLLIVLPISVLNCYFFYVKIPGSKFFRAIMYLPNIIASSALVTLFKYGIGYGGPLEALASHFGVEYTYPLSSEPAAIITILIYTIFFGFGTNIILIGGAMNGMNPEMLESARIDGCNWFQELVRIIIPSIWPTISTIVILSFASMLGSTGPILAFTKGEAGTMTLSFYIYKLVAGIGTGVADLNLASALGITMTLVSLPLVFVVKRLLYGKEE